VARLRIVTAGAGAGWEAALVQACQDPTAAAEVVQRCYDLGDLLAVAAAGHAQVALVAAGTRWLDREAVSRLAAAGLALVGVVPGGDEDAERRLRQLGIGHVSRNDDPPGALLDLAGSAATDASGEPGRPSGTPEPDQAGPAGRDHALVAVWGPKGAPGRTTVAVNLAFEAAPLAGETLLVDADTYGGSVAQALGFLHDYPGLAWAARLAGRGELDAPRLWQATRRAAPEGPRVLAGLPRAELWTEVRPSTWESLLQLFRVAFPLTILDLGFCLEEDEELLYDQVRFRRNAVSRSAIANADLLVAVARADPVGLHDFIRAWQQLGELGIPGDRVRLVVNQVRGGLFGGDPASQIRAALARYLGIEPAAFVPYDRAALDAALMAGQALAEARPGAPAQQALAALAADTFGERSPGQPRRARRRRSARTRLLPRARRATPGPPWPATRGTEGTR
jgi:MinD-like ATPase involved in chromosome partitioning or flagellar assembly